MRATRALILVALACSSALARGQSRADDILVLEDGSEIRGTLVQRYGEELLILDAGKRRRVARADLRTISLSAERTARWLSLRRPDQSTESRWQLVAAAQAAGLERMAELAALEVMLVDPQHSGARDVAGARFDAFFAAPSDLQNLSSEHYLARSEVGLARTLEVLFDLEALLVRWHAEFGTELEPLELTTPLQIELRAGPEAATVHHAELRHPHYDPGRLLGSVQTTDNRLVTWYEPLGARPLRLFDLAAQQLIYSTLVGEQLVGVPHDTSKYRENAFLEVGLGAWFERTMDGPPGHARPSAFRRRPKILLRSLNYALSDPIAGRRPELEHLFDLTYERLQAIEVENDLYWAKAESFVGFLMDPTTVLESELKGRDVVLRALRAAHKRPRGAPQEAWTRALESPDLVELEDRWRRWCF